MDHMRISGNEPSSAIEHNFMQFWQYLADMIVECLAYLSYKLYKKCQTYSLLMCVQENDTFSREFDNGVVLTTKNTEHPGKNLKKKMKNRNTVRACS